MQFMKTKLCTGLLLIGLWANSALAAENDILAKAQSAYNNGRYKEVLQMVQPMASDGNAQAQYLLGKLYENGVGVPQDIVTAVKWYQLAAEQNDAKALVSLAYCYELGVGIPKDTAKTVELMQKAAEVGSPEAQYNLGLYTGRGQYGMAKDRAASFSWVSKSAEAGFAQAERLLGAYYEFGIGTAVNQSQAKVWYAKAKAKGLERADVIKTVHDFTTN